MGVIVSQGAAMAVINQLEPPVLVVYIRSGDPVASGFADSLSQPNANMTGLNFMFAKFNGKRLELLCEIVPKLRRVAIIASPEHPGRSASARFWSRRVASSGCRSSSSPPYLPASCPTAHRIDRSGGSTCRRSAMRRNRLRC